MYWQLEKKLVKQQYVLHMSPQYGELRPTSGWDRFTSVRHPCKFRQLSRLGSITAWQSSNECQLNFAALNRECHLCSAGRPSRWALAHISSYHYNDIKTTYKKSNHGNNKMVECIMSDKNLVCYQSPLECKFKQELSSCWDRWPFGYDRHGPKSGAPMPLSVGGSWVPI